MRTTVPMSTGIRDGTESPLFGRPRGIIGQRRRPEPVAGASAVLPPLAAAFVLPRGPSEAAPATRAAGR